MPDPTTIGPFRVLRPLGRGGTAAVYAVEHAGTGTRRALKILHARHRDDEAHRRFLTEYEVLAALDHPNIIHVHERGEHDGRPWFTMDLLEGRDLHHELETWRDLPHGERFRRTQRILVQLASALAWIHDRGLVHRDVTPGNIFIEEGERVVLTDFGVARAPGQDLTRAGEMVGTVAFMAPEQIRGGPVDARTDLYELGVVLYLMLTGRRPFHARTVAGYLEKHLHLEPRPPRELDPFVPEVLDTACRRLLRKDPEERYGSAWHLLAVIDREAAGAGRWDPRRWPPRLVGRTRQRALLRDRLMALREGRGSMVSLEAPIGFGKTSLVEEVEAMALSLGLPVSRVSCSSSRRAYGPFVPLARELAGPGRPLPPALEAAFGGGRSQVERYAVMAAFRDLLRASLPRVVIVEGLHDADRSSVEMLAFLGRNLLHLAREPVFLLLARRSDEATGEPLGIPLPLPDGVLERLVLPPLNVTSVEELVVTLVPDDERARRLARRLHREGEGNPVHIVEMLRDLVREGRIAPDPSGSLRLELDTTEVTSFRLPLPRGVRESLRSLLGPLSADAREVASVVAVSRQEVTHELLVEALGCSEDWLLDQLDELSEAGVIRYRGVGTDERLELSRPRLRDLVIEDLDAERLRGLHLAVGNAIERLYRHRSEEVVEALAWHFEQADLPTKAFPYLVRAGKRLFARGMGPEALDVFERALRVEPRARPYAVLDDADRALADLHLARGRAMFHVGDWPGAREALEQADALAREIGDPALRSETAAELGNALRTAGLPDQAEPLLTEALSLAQRIHDDRLEVMPLYGLGAIQWTRGDLEGARRQWAACLRVAGRVEDDRALGLCYNGLGLAAMCEGRAAEARKHFEESARTLERVGMIAKLSIIRGNLAELAHCTGNLRKGLQQAEQAIARSREVHHGPGIALGLRYRSLLLVDIGRYAEAEENAREALRRSRRMGALEDVLAAYVSLIRIPLHQGRFEAARSLLTEFEPLLEGYDAEGFTPVVHAWFARVDAELGRPIEEVRRRLASACAEARGVWPHQRCRVLLTAGRTFLTLGDREEAASHLQKALELADSAGFRLYALKAHALLAAALADTDRARQHRQQATSLARSLAAGLSREDGDRFLALHGATHDTATR